MQRNRFGSRGVECGSGVGANSGFIYDPGGRNVVVCDGCAYLICGRYKGFPAEPETAAPEPSN
ncbi:hypothetical protein [Nocardia abscessus]|uniref:hypothetical protein n=1 Tax=Nocardia abscessus TaxID=120957 RepID=UPI002455A6B9|nr:hypothetical protein [Nocardia abscessus]